MAGLNQQTDEQLTEENGDSFVKHILNVGSEDCLGLGSDFDGVESLPQSMAGVQSLPLRVVREMEKQSRALLPG